MASAAAEIGRSREGETRVYEPAISERMPLRESTPWLNLYALP